MTADLRTLGRAMRDAEAAWMNNKSDKSYNAWVAARTAFDAALAAEPAPAHDVAELVEEAQEFIDLSEPSHEAETLVARLMVRLEALARERDEAAARFDDEFQRFIQTGLEREHFKGRCETAEARVKELEAALAEISCGYYADHDAPWRLDRVVNIARAATERLPWEPIAEAVVTPEEKARGAALRSDAVAASEARVKALRTEMERIADVTERWTDSLVSQVNEIARAAIIKDTADE